MGQAARKLPQFSEESRGADTRVLRGKSGVPITFLHARTAHVIVMDDHDSNIVAENDTKHPYSDDSDTA